MKVNVFVGMLLAVLSASACAEVVEVSGTFKGNYQDIIKSTAACRYAETYFAIVDMYENDQKQKAERTLSEKQKTGECYAIKQSSVTVLASKKGYYTVSKTNQKKMMYAILVDTGDKMGYILPPDLMASGRDFMYQIRIENEQMIRGNR